jgi:hypothetical protein
MRIILVTIGVLFVCFIGLLTTKYWGLSQVYPVYQHAFFEPSSDGSVILFTDTTGYSRDEVLNVLAGAENLFLNVAFTSDHILVLPIQKLEKNVRNFSYADLKEKSFGIEELAPYIKQNRRIIFNLLENTRAEHEVFVENLKKIGYDKATNFLVMSDYEAPIKALKELAPTYVYGTTRPEILKIVAMKSMNILEAVSLRADALVQPLKLRNKDFYDDEVFKEMRRRHKIVIVGPISSVQRSEAEALKPFGIILSRK